MAEEYIQNRYRFREGLMKKLERAAKKNDHSVNMEMAGRLESSFDKEEEAARFGAALNMLVGGDDRAQLVGMLATAVAISKIGNDTTPNNEYNTRKLARATSEIVRFFGGYSDGPYKWDDLEKPKDQGGLGLSQEEASGVLLAAVVLEDRGLGVLVEDIEELQPQLSLADLGKRKSQPLTLATLGKIGQK